MSATTVERVTAHYSRWPFPSGAHRSREGLTLLRSLREWLRATGSPRVVDVGCGTGDTVVALAKRMPGAEFLGVDVSEASLDLARRLARDAGVSNVTFRPLDLSRALPDLEPFDAVLSLGVLHHLPDLRDGFRKVGALAAPGAPIVLWLYGRHGRMAHGLNQEFLRLLARGDAEAAPAVARTFVESLGERFVEGTGFYTPENCGRSGLRWLLEHPVWLADQMFPAFEQCVTMGDILELFDSTGIAFERWFGVRAALSEHTSEPLLLERFERLSDRERLLAMDLLLRPAYYFVAGRRPPTAREGGAP
ncbi:MAG TPA: class I SAM-dependent methyltransferase [Candidatus Eisenbacteria bacterium]|nr:class I SAM-dependent methyltransferase [Candidatus Eisenbacteria bacterium]